MNKNHDCGSCKHFLKMKAYSLCNLHDARARADTGRKCPDFKRIKFHKSIAITTMTQQATQTELGNS